MSHLTLRRRDAMSALAGLLTDPLVVLSLGGSVDEWYTAAPHLREASLFQQQLGCVSAEALGLALGLPHRQVVALDTDGGLLFNLGVLATLAIQAPPNLLVVVWDNECYQSIGGPRTHTASPVVDLAAIARGAGIEDAVTVRDAASFTAACAAGLAATVPHVVVAKVDTSPAGALAAGEAPVRRKHSDGREDTYTFVRHVERTENITIMGPSEHN